MEDEMMNMVALKAFMENLPSVNHVSKVLSVFYADVLYQDDAYEEVFLKETEVRFLHGYNNEVTISGLQPPYYDNFWFSRQHFEYKGGKLYISGCHHNEPSKKYVVRIG